MNDLASLTTLHCSVDGPIATITLIAPRSFTH